MHPWDQNLSMVHAPMLIFFSPQSHLHSFDIGFQQGKNKQHNMLHIHDVLRRLRHLHPHPVEIANAETKIYTQPLVMRQNFKYIKRPVFLLQNQTASSTCRFYSTASALLTLLGAHFFITDLSTFSLLTSKREVRGPSRSVSCKSPFFSITIIIWIVRDAFQTLLASPSSLRLLTLPYRVFLV